MPVPIRATGTSSVVVALIATTVSVHAAAAAEPSLPRFVAGGSRYIAADSSYRVGGKTALPEAIEAIRPKVMAYRLAEAESLTVALLRVVKRERPDSAQVGIVEGFLLYILDEAGDRKRLAEAEQLGLQALAILERTRGRDHPTLGFVLGSLAGVLAERREFERAKSLLDRSLALRERALGPDHPDVALALLDLRSYCEKRGDYPCMKAMAERALAINERALGPDHFRTNKSRHGLAFALWKMGRHREAARLMRQVADWSQRVNGPDHPNTVKTKMLLGTFLKDAGDGANARAVFEANIATIERLGMQNDQNYLYDENLNSLSLTLKDLGDLARARVISERYLAMTIADGRPSSVAMAAFNHGQLLEELGDELGATPLFQRALELDQKENGPEHDYVAQDLLNLGTAQHRTGRREESERNIRRAIDIWTKIDQQPRLAEGLSGLGTLRLSQGRYAEAESLFRRAVQIVERVWTPSHPQAVGNRTNMALAALGRGEIDSAFAWSREAENDGREQMRLSLRVLPERQAMQYAVTRKRGLDLMLELAARAPSSARSGDAYDALIRSRALVVDEMAARSRILATAGGDTAFAELRASREKLSELILRGVADDSPSAFRDSLERARQRKEAAEEALAQRGAPFRRERDEIRIGYPEVLAALPEGASLVSYVRTERESRRILREGEPMPRDRVPMYAAVVLTRGDAGAPRVLDLGPAAPIDSLVLRWRELAGKRVEGPGTGLHARACGRAGDALRAAVWDPIAAWVGRSTMTLLVPDGALQLVNFAALPAADGRFLVESGSVMHLLTTERDLVPSRVPRTAAEPLLAMGAPEFDAEAFVATTEDPDRPLRGPRSLCGSAFEAQFPALPATEREVVDLVRRWQRVGRGHRGTSSHAPSIRIGPAATEAAFKEIAPKFEMLHLATHGFFAGSRCANRAPVAPGHAADSSIASFTASVARENPLLLSGLAWSGANRRSPSGAEDGLLTAEEIAALDLSATRLAVLSACETGVGEVTASEGVLGLRRAFRLAGTRTLIMSLWPVEDAAAQAWMAEFYDAYLHGRGDVAHAVRAASLKLLRVGRSGPPSSWGAFVAIGDWR